MFTLKWIVVGIYTFLQCPPECDYEPVVPYTIVEYHIDDIPQVCLRPGKAIFACTFFETNTIAMPIMEDSVTPEVYNQLLRHEKGHINCGDWHP